MTCSPRSRSGSNVAASAASLHIRRNSLRYRLGRAEQLLGRSLKQPSTITAVYLALVAEAARAGCADAEAEP